MNQDQMKQAAAEAALAYIERDSIVGVGTGSTVNFFIEALAKIKNTFEAAVASSNETAMRLKAHQIPVYDLNAAPQVDIYIDGADEFNSQRCLIKGGGGALTREKILATAAKKFVCIVDILKEVAILGQKHPVPIEVIPMARSLVARQIIKLGGDPVYRENFITDNQNVILDVYNLKILEPLQWEQQLKNIVGVVENGIFANKKADVILCSDKAGIKQI